jgi:hypothetical protein
MNEPGNYRPISVIPNVAKIVEKLIKRQIVNHFGSNNLFDKSQHAYLKGHSTQTALHILVDTWLHNINNNLINGVIMLDLSKGFDTICTEILIKKLQKYGITGNSLTWFQSYLSNRTQFVRHDNKISTPRKINIGVPQGTILGPILFLIYMNDLPNNVTSSLAILYADDTTFPDSAPTYEELQTKLNNTLTEASHWFHKNRLIINISKSSLLLISTRYNLEKVPSDFIVKLDGTPLPIVTCTKLLGVVIDSTLTWDKHIEYICNKLSPRVGMLHRLRLVIPLEYLTLVYTTMVQSVLDYCITVWGNSPKKYFSLAQRIQNSSSRAVTGQLDYRLVSSMN